MNIYETLMNIQSELIAPKSQRNTFGNYNYRSCEDILEALKPLLKKYNAVIVLDDDLVDIGNRFYVKANARFYVTSEVGCVEVSAYAREDETKKGMDLAQITGSVSSYARKYALNGLFAIDDTKDSDSTNNHSENNSTPTSNKLPSKNKSIPVNKKMEDEDKKALIDNSLASDAQVNFINKLIKSKNYTDKAMISYIETAYKKKDLKALTKQEASEVINMLNGMK